MGTVVEFRRPPPATPDDPPPRELCYVYLDKFDELTRWMAKPDITKEDILEFFDRWRVH